MTLILKRLFKVSCQQDHMHWFLEWAFIHRDELLEDWKLASEMKEIKKIEPLI
jgi:hypothetical protein